MTTSSDLSGLRIDRSEPPAGGGRSRLPWVLAGLVVVAAAAAFLLTRGPGRTDVQVGLAESTGGRSLSGAGISANGYVVARTKAFVSSKILGRLAWVGVTEGSHLKLGEIIARLESADYAPVGAGLQPARS